MTEELANNLQSFFKTWQNDYDLEIDGYSEFWDFWDGAKVDGKLNVPDLGEFIVVEHEVGKAGTVTVDDHSNIWDNWIIIRQNDRHFRLQGEYDSWDAKGWDGNVDEVEKVAVKQYIWEVKHDY